MTARAERYANAELIRTPRNSKRHDAIDADACQKRCDRAEQRGESRDQTLVHDGVVHKLFERCDFAQRQVRIDLMNCPSYLRDQHRGFACMAHDERIKKSAADMLCVRIERRRTLHFVEVLVLRILHDADYFKVLKIGTVFMSESTS